MLAFLPYIGLNQSTQFYIVFSYFVCAELLQSCLTLCDPKDRSLAGFSLQGFSRQEYWRGFPWPPPGELPDRDQTGVSYNAKDSLTTEPTGKPHFIISLWLILSANVIIMTAIIIESIYCSACAFFTLFHLVCGTVLKCGPYCANLQTKKLRFKELELCSESNIHPDAVAKLDSKPGVMIPYVKFLMPSAPVSHKARIYCLLPRNKEKESILWWL